jgi:neutral ceramidase
MSRSRWTKLLALASALAPAACCGPSAPSFPTTPAPVSVHGPVAVNVGTGRADVTMPPGAATFGHALESRVADGFWTRTYCRVFYFELPGEQRLALVPCELPAMSALLQRRVAEKVTDLLHLSELMITAVHTHAGVGHYFGAAQYTDIFSSRLPGYDPALVEEMATRIATAIRDAARCKKPARLAWGHDQTFWCQTRNRSLDAYRLNHAPFIAPGAPACALGKPELLAVDPAVDVLRIDRYDPAAPTKSLGPIGSISFFAMHPTVLGHTNQLFGGDTAGIVARYVEQELRSEEVATAGRSDDACESDPLHGVINTNEGDISPIWSRGDINEAIEVGTNVADHVWRAHPPRDSGKPAVIVDSRYMEEDLRGARFYSGKAWQSLCSYGELGQGSARGASDHLTTALSIPMFGTNPVADYASSDCHAPKMPLLGPLSVITQPKGQFPSDVPLAVAQIDDTLISFVPAEMTITAGHRLDDEVMARVRGLAGAPRHAIVAGLANEYVQYVATREEYALQAYEGASTLYGANSAEYFANRFGLLAQAMVDPTVDRYVHHTFQAGQAKEMTFTYGHVATRMAQSTGAEVPRKPLGTCLMPNTSEPPAHSARGVVPRICFYWQDGGPGDVPLHQAPWVSLESAGKTAAPVQVGAARLAHPCKPGCFVDDRGDAFRTRIHDEVGDGWVWSTLFAPAREVWDEVAKQRVQITVAGRPPGVASDPFGAGKLPADCKIEQARLCIEGEQTMRWTDIVEGGRRLPVKR